MIIENYIKAKQTLYNHVGFVEDWTVYAIEDRTNMYWTVDKAEKEFVRFAEK